MADLIRNPQYQAVREAQKSLRTAQIRAVVAVNRELVLLYWQTGREIFTSQATVG